MVDPQHMKLIQICRVCNTTITEHNTYKRSKKICKTCYGKQCNCGLGYFKDNVDTMRDAIKYLETFNDTTSST